MVLLTMTPSMVEALKMRQEVDDGPRSETVDEEATMDREPSLENPAVGNPISHGQIIGLWKSLRCRQNTDWTLEDLLRSARIYVPPEQPKPEPSDEYKALMARLRREEEQRAYERMANPVPPAGTFSQRYPASTMARTFAEVNRPSKAGDEGDDEVTYNDVHRQVMLVVNLMATIFGVAAALWVLARWWSTPARIFLSMGGSVLVGIVEVVLYSGYTWHLNEARKGDKKAREMKEVVQTWVVDGRHADSGGCGETDVSKRNATVEESSLRRRKQKEPG